MGEPAMSETQTIGDVLSQLVAEGYIDELPENAPFNTDDDTPAYIKALLGFGGWIAALFFFGFAGFCLNLTLSGIESELVSGAILCVIGLILVGSTTIMQRQSKGVFFSQVALAIHVAGQLLFMVGMGMVFYEWFPYPAEFPTVLFALIIIVLEIILIPLYEDGIFRFLATIAAVIAANVIVYELNIPASLSVLTALLAFGVMMVWGEMLPIERLIRHRLMLQAVGYGLVFGLFGTIMHELSNSPTYEGFAQVALHQPIITSILLLGMSLWLEMRLLAEYEVPYTHRATLIVLGITVIIMLPTLTTPGILASMLLILLGYRRRHNVLLVLAYLFMAGFISYFYYSLHMTLLVKSFILMATGILFLIGGLAFRRLLPAPEPKEI
jgi:hypothetical protein